MLATDTVLLLLTTWMVQGSVIQVNTTTTFTGRPRDCHDLKQLGNLYEGHYIVYPETPNKASMIYCSQDEGMEPQPSDKVKEPARNCLELLQDGITNSGAHIIYPYPEHPADPVLVLCDQETDGGGWTVIQKRYDGSEEFYRTFDEYAQGFGNAMGEHYLGNEIIAAITGQSPNELRVELEDWDGTTAYAHYQVFQVGSIVDSYSKYRLDVLFYDGTAGDSLDANNNGCDFSTFDSDNSGTDCAEREHGAWWYWNVWYCSNSNLNGRYYQDATDSSDSMCWYGFRRWWSLKASTMLIRPSSTGAIHTAGPGDNHTTAGQH